MSMILDGSNGLTTPGVVNTAGETIATTLVVTGVTTLTGGLNAALPVLSGGTGVTTSTGTTNVVLSNSPTLVSPALGTPASGVLTNCTGTANSLNAGIGVNQTWQNVFSSPGRAMATTYTNSTGKPITVYVTTTGNTAAGYFSVTVDAVRLGNSSTQNGGGPVQLGVFIVPNGSTYILGNASGTATINFWTELR